MKKSPSARATTTILCVNCVLFGLLGVAYFWSFWDGISEWWRITSLTWEEVKDTPYQSIWTSGRVIPASLFVMTSVLNAIFLYHHLKTKRAEHVVGGNGV